MNYTKDTGWYYRSADDRAAAWTGVEYLKRFLIQNISRGPAGRLVSIQSVEPGDIAQLLFSGMKNFSHSLFITQTGVIPTLNNLLVCTHTNDSLDRPLSLYTFEAIRFIHIDTIRS